VRRLAPLLATVVLVGCSSDAKGSPEVGVATSTSSSTNVPVSSSSTTSSTSSTSTSSTTTTTTVPDLLGEEVIGTSAGGRPITAFHRGTPGGTVVLVVGVIHGNEAAGLGVIDVLRTAPLPPGIDLWLLPELNPDGVAAGTRGNANLVDLNRNFPHDWVALDEPGAYEYSGTGPASEPETQAFIAFTERIRPRLTLWYHQDLYRISPSTGADAALRQRYAELTGLDYLSVTGGRYSGVAATWVRTSLPRALSFIVELGPSLSAEEAVVHASAVLEISTMAASG